MTAFRIVASAALAIGAIAAAGSAARAEDKAAELARIQAERRANLPVTLTNGTGDAHLTVTVDGYGSFGSTTPAGDVSYDPVGPIGASGAVWESAVLFSPTKQFLSTSGMHVANGLPAVDITKVNARVATSTFKLGGFTFALRQEVLTPSDNGTTFVQTYKITNKTGGSRSISLSRYLEGDLYFVGSYGNDFGGVSADRKTVFQFDTGDDPRAATTFVGITSTGGTPNGYSVWPYRFTDPVVALGKITPEIRNKVYQDADNDRVTDTGFDAGIIQQNDITIPNGGTVTYVTKTRFGSGSIVAQVSKLSGCVTLNGKPVVDRPVEARQTGLTTQTTRTDTDGCYVFQKLTVGKPADIVVKLPTITK